MTVRLHALEVGEDGRLVVFLHGLLGQGRNFNQIAKALRPGFRSLLVDLPNHGRSAWTDDVDYDAVADQVAQWLREHHHADLPAHVVGHSMGGKVAMMLALRHPDVVDRLVVADIAPSQRADDGEFGHLLDSLLALDIDALESRSDADAALAEQVDDERVRGFLLQNLRSTSDGFAWQANLELLRAELPAIGGFPATEATFDHPVLWIAGELSPYIRPQDAPVMRALFPRTRLVTLKQAGHWVHSEQPDAFVSALKVFLTG